MPTSSTMHPFGDWPRPLAFALSGGGAFGSVHVGMLRALLERGVRPDLVVGTSVGALHGALLAEDVDGAVERLDWLWRGMDRRALFGGRITLAKSLVRTRTMSDHRRLDALIRAHLHAERFEDLDLPFAAVVTDALSGEPDLVQNGAVRPALLASAAVPGIFPPVEIEGRLYIDGGVSANVPIRQAISFGAASVIALDATPVAFSSSRPRSFSGGLIHSMSLMLRNQRSNAVEELAHRYRIAVMPSPTPPDLGSFNFDRTDELLQSSHAASSAVLDEWSVNSDRL